MRYSTLIVTTLALLNLVNAAPITNIDVAAVKDIPNVSPHLIPIAKRKVLKRTAEEETAPSPAEEETATAPAEGEEENSTPPAAAEDENNTTPDTAEDENNATPDTAEDENNSNHAETGEVTNRGRQPSTGSKDILEGLTSLLEIIRAFHSNNNGGVDSADVSDDPKSPH